MFDPSSLVVSSLVETPFARRSERWCAKLGLHVAARRQHGQNVLVTRSTLEAAKAGDERAFHEVVSPHLRELHVHCYRMLGSIADADDALQESLLAAWRGLDGFAGRSSIRTWLYRVATNRCLNAIRENKRHRPAEPIPPFEPPEPTRRSEVTWLQPYPDTWLDEGEGEPGPAARYSRREAVELAFMAALQRLPPRQTAALLLCDVLGYSTAETAAMLETSGAAIKGALQRARASLARLRATRGGHSAARPGTRAESALARRFAEAFICDDIDAVLALLTDDAWLAMPPASHEYQGPEAIGRFLRTSSGWRGRRLLRLVPGRANRQPAFGCYLVDPDGPTSSAGILVLTLSEGRISAITRFLDPTLPPIFRLDEVLEGRDLSPQSQGV